MRIPEYHAELTKTRVVCKSLPCFSLLLLDFLAVVLDESSPRIFLSGKYSLLFPVA